KLIHGGLMGLLGLMLILGTGCIYISGSGFWAPQVKYERVVELSSPIEAGGEFVTQTHNGYIVIEGAPVSSCSVLATITGGAPAEEDAQRLAEETDVKLVPLGNKLTAKIVKPKLKRNESICVNLDVSLPDQADLDLVTHNGEIFITNVSGSIEGVTHNGNVDINNVAGVIDIDTHNGSFVCEEVSGDLDLKTHNGRVFARYAEKAPAVCDVRMVSHNGDVDLKAPADFSATVTVKTYNGSIRTDLPLTVTGKYGKRSLRGAIGEGEGNLYMETHNGSIKIR
ncbi:MAG: DUF4097 family beta strand repeat protein, partial [Planctomycetes bacterium]|nr:DUF4097 family beta strand repeat protein [Planctomycetota bacterium]